jgi:hypothetical protein
MLVVEEVVVLMDLVVLVVLEEVDLEVLMVH